MDTEKPNEARTTTTERQAEGSNNERRMRETASDEARFDALALARFDDDGGFPAREPDEPSE